jgi:hypothetical protein
MYVPWEPIDVIRMGRIKWQRGNTTRARYGLFINQYYWKVEPAFAPFITGYGVLVSKVYYNYSGVTPELKAIYNGLIYSLSRILSRHNIEKNAFWEKIHLSNPFLRSYWSYRVATDLYNDVIGRSNRAITAASARLSESNLSAAERFRIERMISRSNSMICMYDFKRDYLYKPPRRP